MYRVCTVARYCGAVGLAAYTHKHTRLLLLLLLLFSLLFSPLDLK